jgi:hypothetical protein
MLEDTVSALFRAGDVFADLAQNPAPSYGVMIPNLLVFCATLCAGLLLRAGIAPLGILHASPTAMLLAAALGLILAVPLSFLAAGALHAFMLLSGGAGDFQRSYQAASMFSILIALQAMLNWFDWVWALPALLTAYMGAAAARTIHRAPALRAGVVFCLLAGSCVAGQWWLREQYSRWSQTATALQTTAMAAQDLGRQLQQFQQLSALPEPSVGGTNRGVPEASGAGAAAAPNSPQSVGPSSLDLLISPSETGSPPAGATSAQLQAQAQGLQQATANMLSPMMAMLQNPALTKGMSPEQVKQMGSVTGMLSQLQKDMTSGKKTTPEEQAAVMAQFQAAMMKLMTQVRPAPATPRKGTANPGQDSAKMGLPPPVSKPDAVSPPKGGAESPAAAPAPAQPSDKESQ